MLNTSESVQILLSTYNGSRYIQQQLDSIIKQTYLNWNLLIRDDGSFDNTLELLHQYHQNDNRINIFTDNRGNLGVQQSFGLLLQNSSDVKYVMFADQDDVWMQDKIELTLDQMLKSERHLSSSHPILIYTNFIYVDKNLKVISAKKNFTPVKLKNLSFNNFLAQNSAYGCTMMLNQSLKQLIKKIPAAAENHDYWVALTASAFGEIIYLSKATVLYRQHQQNISGQHDNNSFIKRLKRINSRKNIRDVENKIIQAIAFKDSFVEVLSDKQSQAINDFILLAKKKSVSLFIKNWKNGLKRQTFMQTILFYLSILTLKSSSKFENRY